jgi:hypothetical protein
MQAFTIAAAREGFLRMNSRRLARFFITLSTAVARRIERRV